jgi:DNA repair protein RecN (Recombination protein N)
MLHRLAIRDFVIVDALELELASGFSVLSGETGAGKSILVDALQLALGGRGDAGVVREGSGARRDQRRVRRPAALARWLADAGFDADAGDAGRMLLRRTIDAQGKSRAWINGSGATIAQLREAAEHSARHPRPARLAGA